MIRYRVEWHCKHFGDPYNRWLQCGTFDTVEEAERFIETRVAGMEHRITEIKGA